MGDQFIYRGDLEEVAREEVFEKFVRGLSADRLDQEKVDRITGAVYTTLEGRDIPMSDLYLMLGGVSPKYVITEEGQEFVGNSDLAPQFEGDLFFGFLGIKYIFYNHIHDEIDLRGLSEEQMAMTRAALYFSKSIQEEIGFQLEDVLLKHVVPAYRASHIEWAEKVVEYYEREFGTGL